MTVEYLRFGLFALFLLGGVFILLMTMVGLVRFEYVMNRIHAAAMGDSLGFGLIMIALMIYSGMNMITVKMMLVLGFMWITNPITGHMLAQLEIETDPLLDKFVTRMDLTDHKEK